jgi:hypothetical protein
MKKTKEKASQDEVEIKMQNDQSGSVRGVGSATATIAHPDPGSRKALWHHVLRSHGKYFCYAVFLLLPSDIEAIRFFKEFGKELDMISGKECLVLAFGKTEYKGPEFDSEIWTAVVDEHIADGISVTLAKIFNIPFTQFPCIVVFKDLRASEHVIINLKGYTAQGIAENSRQIFSVIGKARIEKQDPLMALNFMRNTKKLQKAGLSIISEIRSFAGTTLGTAVEALIKANIP